VGAQSKFLSLLEAYKQKLPGEATIDGAGEPEPAAEEEKAEEVSAPEATAGEVSAPDTEEE
jgi:hypothetical protein